MNSNIRKIIFFVLIMAMTYSSYVFMIKPANKDLAIQKQKLGQKISKLRELETAPEVLQNINAQLARLEGSINILESKLPSRKDIHTVLEDITVIAQDNGLIANSVRTLTQKSNNGYIEQPIKLEVSGEFKSYYSFLLSLEKLDRITKISEMNISTKKNEDGVTSASFVLSIFFQRRSV
jgi:type IV pilus assembly protein PilO